MDGVKTRLRRSIRFRLAWWLSLVLTLLALLAAGMAFRAVYDEANDWQDDILRQAAALVSNLPMNDDALRELNDELHDDRDFDAPLVMQPLRRVAEADPARSASSSASADRAIDAHPPGENAGQGPGGKREQEQGTARSDDDEEIDEEDGLPLPADLRDGMHTIALAGRHYRVLVDTAENGLRFAVSQETGFREEIARETAFGILMPMLPLLPLLLALVVWLVNRMFRPLSQLASEVDARREDQLHALADRDLPSEVSPFVRAINRLLGRVQESMAVQRRFVADAAHELRSPLTALSLQAERLAAVPLPDEASQRLAILRAGIERGRSLLEQLLSLARMQDQEPAEAPRPVAVRALYRRVLEGLMPLADAKRLDVGLLDGDDVWVVAREEDLSTLVRNLLDNAIRYTPEGGQVDLDVRREGQRVVLEVEDSGIGIPQAERERVLDPFYRVLGTGQSGSGLGLSIVRAIAQRLNADLQLLDSTRFSQGLKVRVVLRQSVD